MNLLNVTSRKGFYVKETVYSKPLFSDAFGANSKRAVKSSQVEKLNITIIEL